MVSDTYGALDKYAVAIRPDTKVRIEKEVIHVVKIRIYSNRPAGRR